MMLKQARPYQKIFCDMRVAAGTMTKVTIRGKVFALCSGIARVQSELLERRSAGVGQIICLSRLCAKAHDTSLQHGFGGNRACSLIETLHLTSERLRNFDCTPSARVALKRSVRCKSPSLQGLTRPYEALPSTLVAASSMAASAAALSEASASSWGSYPAAIRYSSGTLSHVRQVSDNVEEPGTHRAPCPLLSVRQGVRQRRTAPSTGDRTPLQSGTHRIPCHRKDRVRQVSDKAPEAKL